MLTHSSMLRLPSILASSLLVSALATGCVIEAGGTATIDPSSTLTVDNNSSFDLKELHLTLSTSASWGPNLLGQNLLLPGESIVLDGISCDTYDVLMVDETNAQCETNGVSICFGDAAWEITNNTCNVFARSADPTPIAQRVRAPSKSTR